MIIYREFINKTLSFRGVLTPKNLCLPFGQHIVLMVSLLTLQSAFCQESGAPPAPAEIPRPTPVINLPQTSVAAPSPRPSATAPMPQTSVTAAQAPQVPVTAVQSPAVSIQAAPASAIVAPPPQGQGAEPLLRDPFWPIGYWPPKASDKNTTSHQGSIVTPTVPGQTNVATVLQETVIRWPELKVKGLTRQPDGSYLAIIEGVKNVAEAGQTIQMIRDGIIFRWKIKEITKKGLLQQKLDYKPVRR